MTGTNPHSEHKADEQDWLDDLIEDAIEFGHRDYSGAVRSDAERQSDYQDILDTKAQILAHYAPKPPVTPDTSDGELEYIHSLIHQPEYAVVYPETETEDGNYEVSKRIQEYVHQQRVEAYKQAIQDVKKQGYGYDDGTGFVLKISFSELARLIKELVAEAKPTNSESQQGSVTVYGDLNERDLNIINQFEQNLLKALEEK